MKPPLLGLSRRRFLVAGSWAAAGPLLMIPMHASSKVAAATDSLQTATLGGGCFWCLEAVYERFSGVKTAVSGYAGGTLKDPTYKEVCAGATGHAEVVQIQFDPAQITYAQLLDVFWEAHDPTTPNQQGADRGPQYRSIILHQNAEQKTVAERSLQEAAKRFKAPIVTELVPLTTFYPAEDYHQDFYRRNPQYPYCAIVISPKLKKLEKAKLGFPPLP